MTNSNFKSLGSIIWSIMKNPLAEQLSYEEAAEFALEAIKLLGAPVIYLSKIDEQILQSHKAPLPCDLLYIEGIEYYNSQGNLGIAMREATNTFHMDHDENDCNNSCGHEYTYKIQKGIVYSSMATGCIKIAYKGIATDDDGYPLIPDNQKVQLALEYYILNRYLEPLYLMGKITDKAFEYIQQKRYFYMLSASSTLTMPSPDKMESMMNGLNRLIINTTAHKNSFRNYGEKEVIKKYN